MPPMSSLRTFITALKTGETRTTKALEKLAARRRGVAALQLVAATRHRGAFDAPLSPPFRLALKKSFLPERYIDRCIDAWPDDDKERARRAVVQAIAEGRRLRFRWGLKSEAGYALVITRTKPEVTITALSPRSSLRISGSQIYVAPGPE